MKRIINPKYILYMIFPCLAIVLSVIFFLGNSTPNYAVGGVLGTLGIGIALCLFLFVPHSYTIDINGIKTFYRIKRCNYIPWNDISGINTTFDVFFDDLFFWKDYAISYKGMKRLGRAIDTVTKTKTTASLIEKYWHKGIDKISF